MLKNIFKFSSLGLVIALMAGCSNGNVEMIELQDYVRGVVNRPSSNIEPLPEFISYESFTYGAAGLRGPFDVPVEVVVVMLDNRSGEVRPDETRVKETLENFSVSSLTMIGSLSSRDILWVLLRDATSVIHRVKLGDYLGRNHGRVVAASESQLDIIEIVPSGNGGWIERPQSLLLPEEEE